MTPDIIPWVATFAALGVLAVYFGIVADRERNAREAVEMQNARLMAEVACLTIIIGGLRYKERWTRGHLRNRNATGED